jgi:hypothetical protein
VARPETNCHMTIRAACRQVLRLIERLAPHLDISLLPLVMLVVVVMPMHMHMATAMVLVGSAACWHEGMASGVRYRTGSK